MRHVGKNRSFGPAFPDGIVTPSFTLFDAVLRYDHGPWQFLINANNIFDEKYYAANNVTPGSGGSFYLGSRRTVVGTLKLRF